MGHPPTPNAENPDPSPDSDSNTPDSQPGNQAPEVYFPPSLHAAMDKLKRDSTLGDSIRKLTDQFAQLDFKIPKLVPPAIPPPIDLPPISRPEYDILDAQRDTLEVMRSMLEVHQQSASEQAKGFDDLQASVENTSTLTKSMLRWMIFLNLAVLLISALAGLAAWLTLVTR